MAEAALVVPPDARAISATLLREIEQFDDTERAAIHAQIRVARDFTVWRVRPDKKPKRYAVKSTGQVGIILTPGMKRTMLYHRRLALWAWHEARLMERVFEKRAQGDTKYSVVDNWCAVRLDPRGQDDAKNLAPMTLEESTLHSRTQSRRRTMWRSNAPARSRPVVIAEITAKAKIDRALFPVGHVFPSAMQAARELDFHQGAISRSCKTGCFHQGVKFELGARDDDADLPGELWTDTVILNCVEVRVSSHGRVWFGGIKRRGCHYKDTYYRQVGIGGSIFLVHHVIWRCWNATERDAAGRLVAAEIPEGMLVLHGGPDRAPDNVRRADGTERNWPEDLRLGTYADNQADVKHERALKRRRDE